MFQPGNETKVTESKPSDGSSDCKVKVRLSYVSDPTFCKAKMWLSDNKNLREEAVFSPDISWSFLLVLSEMLNYSFQVVSYDSLMFRGSYPMCKAEHRTGLGAAYAKLITAPARPAGAMQRGPGGPPRGPGGPPRGPGGPPRGQYRR